MVITHRSKVSFLSFFFNTFELCIFSSFYFSISLAVKNVESGEQYGRMTRVHCLCKPVPTEFFYQI